MGTMVPCLQTRLLCTGRWKNLAVLLPILQETPILVRISGGTYHVAGPWAGAYAWRGTTTSSVTSANSLGTGSQTIELWLAISSYPTSATWAVCDDIDSYYGWCIQINTDGSITIAEMAWFGYVYYLSCGLSIPNDSTWHYLAIINQNTYWSCYKDGSVYGQPAGGASNTSQPLKILVNTNLTASISRVAAYGHQLSSNTINSHYNA